MSVDWKDGKLARWLDVQRDALLAGVLALKSAGSMVCQKVYLSDISSVENVAGQTEFLWETKKENCLVH